MRNTVARKRVSERLIGLMNSRVRLEACDEDISLETGPIVGVSRRSKHFFSVQRDENNDNDKRGSVGDRGELDNELA